MARDEAVQRVRAALAARDALQAAAGLDLVVVARTDCRNAAAGGGLQEAIWRCQAFEEAGADVVYAEGLAGLDELRTVRAALAPATHLMLAQVEKPGRTLITPAQAAEAGCSLSLQGLTVFNVAACAMKKALAAMAAGGRPSEDAMLPFDELYREVGFEDHYAWEKAHGA